MSHLIQLRTVMRWAVRVFACSLFAFALLGRAVPVAGQPASSQQALEPAENRASYTFADSATFDVRAAHPTGGRFERGVLRFKVVGTDTINRRVPDFEAASAIQLSHREPMPRGALYPTAQIEWWWTFTDDTGRELMTPAQTFRYVDRSLPWDTLAGEHVTVWYHDADAGAARELLAIAEEALGDVEAMVGGTVDDPIALVAYEEQSDLRRALAARGETYEARLATLGARVAEDVVLLDVGSRSEELSEVVRHELSHVALNLLLEHDWILSPAWLDEGLAMYAEGPLEGDELAALERALESDRLMSVQSLSSFPGDARLVTQAYAQSRDFVAFLIEDHPADRFPALLEAYADGDITFDAALQATFGYDALTMYQAYRQDRGLPPAATPAPGEEPRSARRAPPAPRSPGCGSIGWLLVMAVFIANRRDSRRAHPMRSSPSLRRSDRPKIISGQRDAASTEPRRHDPPGGSA